MDWPGFVSASRSLRRTSRRLCGRRWGRGRSAGRRSRSGFARLAIRTGSRRCARGSARTERGSTRSCTRGLADHRRNAPVSAGGPRRRARRLRAAARGRNTRPPLRRRAGPAPIRDAGRRERVGKADHSSSRLTRLPSRARRIKRSVEAPGALLFLWFRALFREKPASLFREPRSKRRAWAIARREFHDSLRGAVSADPEPRSSGRRADRRLPWRGRANGARRRHDLCADAARGPGAGPSAARGERRAEPAPAAHRAARRLRAGRDGGGLRPRGRGRSAGGDPRGGRRAHAPPCARHPHPRLGKGAQGRDPTGGRGRAPHFRRRRARAGRGDPRAGLRARGRSRGADRRHDHRGRAMDEARDARARSL